MNIISCHGLNNRMNQWTFKSGKIVNSNVNYPCPFSRFKQNRKTDLSSAYLRCQVYVTEDFIFSPTPEGCGEIAIHDKKTGENVGILTPSQFKPMNTGCVHGVKNRLILFSGSRRCIRVWGPKIITEKEEENLKKFYEDNWSDSD
ncbi:hypothetical protein B4U80_00373 [Leptotrombidium deliense]|uniref:Uncharacterized protein n=1 Tax=Leptotrombidium deliense TaxID=299467 RepID=A0A443S188_9ACAR|nr:hypothetical protein B4U80_00373 [Leptotrombidium deliense]